MAGLPPKPVLVHDALLLAVTAWRWARPRSYATWRELPAIALRIGVVALPAMWAGEGGPRGRGPAPLERAAERAGGHAPVTVQASCTGAPSSRTPLSRSIKIVIVLVWPGVLHD